jgi:hypothetical protein
LKFFEWLKKSPEQVLKEYKETEDRDECARNMAMEKMLLILGHGLTVQTIMVTVKKELKFQLKRLWSYFKQ